MALNLAFSVTPAGARLCQIGLCGFTEEPSKPVGTPGQAAREEGEASSHNSFPIPKSEGSDSLDQGLQWNLAENELLSASVDHGELAAVVEGQGGEEGGGGKEGELGEGGEGDGHHQEGGEGCKKRDSSTCRNDKEFKEIKIS